MVHSAYDSFELLSACPAKIEAVESYGSKLLLGCSDGSLRIYAPDSSDADRSPTADYRTQSEELQKETIPSFETIAVITKAKGANVFSWDDRRGYLCFARQKRVCIFRHDGGRGFVEVKEFGVPDTVKSMSWCGENICVGIRREYVILNCTNGALSEVFTSWESSPTFSGLSSFWRTSTWKGQVRSSFGMIRSLRDPYSLIQTVVLRNVRHLRQSKNTVIVALENSVYGLFPIPLGAQIVQLTASGNFEEALSLCKLLPPEDSSLRAAKEGSIHIRYAHYLFDNGSYEESMEHFLASQVDITYVLSLYPSIILPKTTVIHEPEKLMDVSWDASYLSRGSSGMSDDMESSPQHMPESDEGSALESKKMNHNTLMALVKFLQKKRYSVVEKATAERTEEVVLDAVGDNFASYNTSRFKKTNKGRGSLPVSSGAQEMAAILDTALIQALLLTGQSSSAVELLRGLNYCDLKICEEILMKSNHHVALLELYRCNSMHREALELLHKLVEELRSNRSLSDNTHRFKPELIIEYLKPLCGTDPMLVLEFSMLGRYLELMLAMDENGISGNLQNEMVHIYLSEVLDWHADLSSQLKWDEKVHCPARKKLLSALEGISGYNPEALLKRLPADALYEERAILLGKMNQHELALSLYVHKLHVPELALSYCDRVYETAIHQPSVKSTGNIYLTLLQIYLNPRRTTNNFEKRITNLLSPQNPPIPKVGSVVSVKTKGGRGAKKIAAIEGAEDMRVSLSSTDSSKSDGDADEPIEEGGTAIMLDEVLDLLSSRWDRINGAQALKLLPRETKLQNLLPFLGPSSAKI
ncbi:vam6/Vps39-like protein [Quillaja saponaria]|uniref:Vam6/Vps39-like protein n=1 Tax=Quillaja saponaria TaxID=32244 RepID=A0AAD7L7F1_QUISA|nr:vam6/Vps39-like protein [Quillaja saponaria]